MLRDDLVEGGFNGNKARKLEYFLHADLSGVKRVVSYGSSQSNAMYSLSVFAKMKGFEFHYVVSNLSSNLTAFGLRQTVFKYRAAFLRLHRNLL